MKRGGFCSSEAVGEFVDSLLAAVEQIGDAREGGVSS